MSNRYEYKLDLVDFSGPSPTQIDGVTVRSVQHKDAEALAVLMIEAYRGTIDYDGETVEDARGEVAAFLAGERGGPALLAQSYLAEVDGNVAAATLVTAWNDRNCPLIAYVMTDAAWKQQGLGRLLVTESLAALHRQGYGEVRAVITAGNDPSERLFLGLGFRKIEQQ